jgi:hypothetical protein
VPTPLTLCAEVVTANIPRNATVVVIAKNPFMLHVFVAAMNKDFYKDYLSRKDFRSSLTAVKNVFKILLINAIVYTSF